MDKKKNKKITTMDKKEPFILNSQDQELWIKYTQGLTPLSSHHKTHCHSSDKKREIKINPRQRVMETNFFSQKRDSSLPPSSDSKYLPLSVGQMHHVHSRTMRTFFSGKGHIHATLDLHGLSQENAHRRLISFIFQCYEQEKRQLLIITGQGHHSSSQGILRQKFNHWLNGHDIRPYILALGNAKPQHGGKGAFYILLKRQRHSENR